MFAELSLPSTASREKNSSTSKTERRRTSSTAVAHTSRRPETMPPSAARKRAAMKQASPRTEAVSICADFTSFSLPSGRSQSGSRGATAICHHPGLDEIDSCRPPSSAKARVLQVSTMTCCFSPARLSASNICSIRLSSEKTNASSRIIGTG